MRTTLDLPAGLVEEARAAIGFKSKTDTVVFALKEVVRRSRMNELKDFIKTMEFDFDPAEMRKKDRARVMR
jgi:Arc/MetJ family transcription regulator